MAKSGRVDPARFDRRPWPEYLNDEIPADDNPRWYRERRIASIKRIAKGYGPL